MTCCMRRFGWAGLFLAAFLTAAMSACAGPTMVPMSDGVALATDVYLPEGEGPFPVVLARSFYGRGAGLAEQFTTNGVAFVIQDTRGRGDSEGEDLVFHTDGWGERQDGADTVRWIREQPWCNGKVGTMGASALGIVQVLMAPATPELTCQAIWVADSSFYGGLSYQGGVWRKELCEIWAENVGSAYRLAEWKAHPTYDAFWEEYNAEAQAERITAPAVHVGGWWDIFQQGTINNFVTRQERGGEGARGNQKLIMGPWLHGKVQEVGDLRLPDNYDFGFEAYSAGFLGHWLTGVDTGVMDEPPVRYYTLGDVDDPEAPGNEWRTADAWPPFETVETPLYLHADGALRHDSPADADASRTFTFDPADPVPTLGGANLNIPAGPFDQREIGPRDDVLKFVTEPLASPLEITGRVKVRLHVSTDAVDTDFTAKLIDVYPDGREILMLDGIRRLKFRNGFERPELLPPGEIAVLEIDLWSISLIFNKGHRIAVHVSSSNHPRFEVNPNNGDDFPSEGALRTAQNTVHLAAERPSALLLPVRPAETP